jgi:hypothetical protein
MSIVNVKKNYEAIMDILMESKTASEGISSYQDGVGFHITCMGENGTRTVFRPGQTLTVNNGIVEAN